MENLHGNEISQKSFVYWFKWILAAIFVFYLVCFFQQKKQKKLDLRTRLWRRFVFTNNELFNYLDDNEKSEMYKVYDTTVKNAVLFQKGNLNAKNTPESPSKNKKKTKRVSFQL